RQSNIPCSKPCSEVCIDLSHDSALPICADCDNRSKEAIGQAMTLIAPSLRAYACSSCAVQAATDLRVYGGKRFNVWGLPPNAFAPNPKSPEDLEPSRSKGQPLPVTGCSCYTKIVDRRLCTPHRVEHFLDLRFKAESMREYVLQRRGRIVCPLCQKRAGADAHKFVDDDGEKPGPLSQKTYTPHKNICYVCMGCSGIVVLDSYTHSTQFRPYTVSNPLELVKNHVHGMLD
ncbi:hypothetical protein GGR51DRAFT_174943, partial [Nemania sp. FL0031]